MRIEKILAVCALLICLGCDYDDPEDPGFPEPADFIRFSGPGVFRETFIDLVFQSGMFAIDVIGDQRYQSWLIGPGVERIPGTDDDAAPYPQPNVRERKRIWPGGIWDKRYWVQFAGGAWNTLNIQVPDEWAMYRASSSPPSFFPKTVYIWCPAAGQCMTWPTAVRRGEVRCYRFTLNGYEQSVGERDCLYHHPRMHWRVTSCDDCPVPATTDHFD
jgi:hypothetical protein